MDWKPITELRSVTCHMGSHSVTCHPTQVNVPHLNPNHAGQYSIYGFTYPEGMEVWVDLDVGYILRWLTCPQTVTHPSSNHLIATRPEVVPTTSRSQVQRPKLYTTKSLFRGDNGLRPYKTPPNPLACHANNPEMICLAYLGIPPRPAR